MNSLHLLECFAATLQADQSARKAGESRLNEYVSNPGFYGACLDIISTDDAQVHQAVKKAAAVFLKNKISRHWNMTDGKGVDAGERPIIKERIIPVIIHGDYGTKQQLIPVLRLLISLDFKLWPGLLDQTGALLQQLPTSDLNDDSLSPLYTGLLCFAEISRFFRWKENKDRSSELDPIIHQAFPHLLRLGDFIVANAENITELSAEILKLILKVYKFVTYFDLPEPLQTKEALVGWGQFHAAILNMNPPAYVIATNTLNEQEKSLLQYSKANKWAIANLNRIFSRYASNNLSKNFQYKQFGHMFAHEFVPLLITNFLGLIEQWCGGDRWIPRTTLYHLIEFLSHCVTQKSTWLLIKPYFETLVSHLVFPLVCPTEETLELFEEDPHQYINSCFDINDDFDSPDTAALGLLVTFAYKRGSATLAPMIQFVTTTIAELQKELQLQETLQVARKKEGALRMLGALAEYIMKRDSPFKADLEPLLTMLVYPNLASHHLFLKARTLEVISKFADLELQDKEVEKLLHHNILAVFDGSQTEISLPVSFEGALAIQAFLQHESFRNTLSAVILPTMSCFLEVSNELDSDIIPMVMQECVEIFAQQLQPFGVDLMTKLAQQFMKVAAELNEAANADEDDLDGNFEMQDDKMLAGIGLINTMITVLLSFENSRDICLHLEQVFSPVIEYVLRHRLDDFLTEVGELMENSTYLLRSISPTMWKNFDLLCESFESGVALMYTEELLQCLQNFMVYGHQDLITKPELAQKFYGIFSAIFGGSEENVGYIDLIHACELAQTFVLSLNYHASPYIPHFVEAVFKIWSDDDKHHVKNTHYDVNVIDVIVACITYEPAVVFGLLQRAGHLEMFLRRWLMLIPQLSRVYDLKLSVMGLLSILSNDEILSNLGPAACDQLTGAVPTLLEALPGAIEQLNRRRKNFGDLDARDSEYQYSGGDWEDPESEDIDDILNAGEAAATAEANSAAAITGNTGNGDQPHEDDDEQDNFINSDILKAAGYYEQEDEEVQEDPLALTPLDAVDIFQVFKGFLEGLHQSDANKYNSFMLKVSATSRVVRDIMENV